MTTKGDQWTDEKLALTELLKEIGKEVDQYLEENRQAIVERYDNASPTVEEILDRLYGVPSDATHPIDAALNLRLILVDLDHWHQADPRLAMYHIGVLRAYLSVCKRETEIPQALMELVRSELGRQTQNRRWEQDRAFWEPLLPKAKERWLTWKQTDGRKIHHNEMADILIEESPQLKSLPEQKKRRSRNRLMNALKELARGIDPSLIRGEHTKKK